MEDPIFHECGERGSHKTAGEKPDEQRVSRRDVFLIPDADGSMQVAEILRLRNTARRTLYALLAEDTK